MIETVKNIHFVGIGGIGMSGIAEILLSKGFNISGSDQSESDNTKYLQKIGAKVTIGHKEENIADAEVIVYSSAVIPDENCETLEAKRLNIPIIKRAEMLAEVSRINYCLAIAGTHGKTTTTSMIGLILIKAGYDPTVIVGGRLHDFGGTNARLGKGDWTVVEADEYDRSFLQLPPTVAVINNIEPEHLDIYKDFEELKNTFLEFANKVPFYGFIVAGLDDEGVCEILSQFNKKVVTFGTSVQSDYYALDISYNESHTKFQAYEKGECLGEIELKIPGNHNLKNALAAISVARTLDIEFKLIKEALCDFRGVIRRFDIKGEKNGYMVVDDYAHHPTEVLAALSSARNGWKRRIICIFQPHTFTRTREFYKEFGKSFLNADILVVTDVYPSREQPIEGITGELIANSARHFGHKNVLYIPDMNNVYDEIKNMLQEGDMLITMGAGNICDIGKRFLET